MQHQTNLLAPAWATDHARNDADGLAHFRETTVEITADGAPHLCPIRATVEDALTNQGGRLVIERSDAVELLVDGVTMSVSDARAVAYAILSVVEAVEAVEPAEVAR